MFPASLHQCVAFTISVCVLEIYFSMVHPTLTCFKTNESDYHRISDRDWSLMDFTGRILVNIKFHIIKKILFLAVMYQALWSHCTMWWLGELHQYQQLDAWMSVLNKILSCNYLDNHQICLHYSLKLWKKKLLYSIYLFVYNVEYKSGIQTCCNFKPLMNKNTAWIYVFCPDLTTAD